MSNSGTVHAQLSNCIIERMEKLDAKNIQSTKDPPSSMSKGRQFDFRTRSSLESREWFSSVAVTGEQLEKFFAGHFSEMKPFDFVIRIYRMYLS